VNDGEERARALGELLQGRDCHVNLIPWNPVLAGEGISYAAPAPGAVAAFQEIVRAHGLSCTVRQEKGQDISGACGQLVIEAARGAVGAGGGGRGGGGAAVGRPPVAGGGARACGDGEVRAAGVRDIEELCGV
jgi:hypothetical protein